MLTEFCCGDPGPTGSKAFVLNTRPEQHTQIHTPRTTTHTHTHAYTYICMHMYIYFTHVLEHMQEFELSMMTKVY